MNEMVQVPSVKQYFNNYIVAGLKDKTNIQEVDLIRIKQQLLDAFRKEIFGQIAFKIGPEATSMSRDDLAKLDTVHNILVQTFRKWKRLCVICSEQGLGNFFQLEDLQKVLEEDEPDPEEVVEIPEESVDVTDQLKDGEKVVITEHQTEEL